MAKEVSGGSAVSAFLMTVKATAVAVAAVEVAWVVEARWNQSRLEWRANFFTKERKKRLSRILSIRKSPELSANFGKAKFKHSFQGRMRSGDLMNFFS